MSGGTKIIYLTRGQFCKVDEDDYEWLNQFKWLACKRPSGAYYARKFLTRNDIKKLNGNLTIDKVHISCENKPSILMHNLLEGFPPNGYTVDHINRNTLDNRRLNLRNATHRQQTLNQQQTQKIPIIKYNGVTKVKNKMAWKIKILCNGKVVYKTYHNDLDAAIAYDKYLIDTLSPDDLSYVFLNHDFCDKVRSRMDVMSEATPLLIYHK